MLILNIVMQRLSAEKIKDRATPDVSEWCEEPTCKAELEQVVQKSSTYQHS